MAAKGLSAVAAARIAGVTVRTISNWCSSGRVIARKSKGAWSITESSLMRALRVSGRR